MSCKISELREQMNSMQALLDTYEHCHVDSVTPEEKIVERTKAKCIEVVNTVPLPNMKIRLELIKAIQGV